jgi:hypothetical protein
MSGIPRGSVDTWYTILPVYLGEHPTKSKEQKPHFTVLIRKDVLRSRLGHYTRCWRKNILGIGWRKSEHVHIVHEMAQSRTGSVLEMSGSDLRAQEMAKVARDVAPKPYFSAAAVMDFQAERWPPLASGSLSHPKHPKPSQSLRPNQSCTSRWPACTRKARGGCLGSPCGRRTKRGTAASDRLAPQEAGTCTRSA